jgi:hypothetical protein
VVAWVASSRLPQRMLSDKPGAINVDRARTQLGTQLEQRQNGDQLLSLVLNNYPDNAYVINSGQTEIKIGNLRQSSVEIPYSLTMNQHWIESFKEALTVVSVKNTDCSRLAVRIADRLRDDPHRAPAVKELGSRMCPNDFDMQVFSKPPGNWFAQSDGYYFADLQTLHVVNSALRPKQGYYMGIRADLLYGNGGIIESRCAKINTERFVNWRQPRGDYNYNDLDRNSLPNMYGHENVYGKLELELTRNHQLKNLSTIRLSMQKTCY